MRRAAVPLMALMFAGVLAGSAQAAETVPLRAAPHDGFGRIVFGWPAPVRSSADIQGGRLVVRFGRPMEAKYGGVLRVLKKYLRAARPAEDGRSVTFDLAGTFHVRHFDLGGAVVVDLLDEAPPRSAAAGHDSAATAPPGGGTAQSVPVRAGDHTGYSRLVFDWRRAVPYRVRHVGTDVAVVFDQAARINLGSLKQQPVKYVGNIRSATTNGHPEITFQVPETSRLRHFRAGPKVVLDVMAPDAAGGLAPSEANGKAPVTPPTILTPVAQSAPGATTAAKPAPLDPRRPLALTPIREAATKAGPPKDGAGARPDATEKMPVAALTPGPIPVASPGTSDAVEPAVLRFDWKEPVGAAIFRRGGRLWVVFDEPKRLNLRRLGAQAGDTVRAIEQIPSEQAAILRIATAPGVNPDLKRDGLAWVLDFRRQPLRAASAIDVTAQPFSPTGAQLFLPITDPGNAIVVKDPEVGDNLIVVPVIPLGQGMRREHRYPQVRFPPTGQGVVVEPRIDDLRVRSLRQGVEVSAGSNLFVSPVMPETVLNAKLGANKPFQRVFGLTVWDLARTPSFIKTKQRLERTVATATGKLREKARLQLARFYFANGLGAEALAVLQMLAEGRPGIMNEPEFRALRGGSEYLMGRFDEAAKELRHGSLDGNDEGAFWRAAVRAAGGDLAGAAPTFKRTGGVIRPYPKQLRVPLGVLMAESAIEAGDVDRGKLYLAVLNLEQPTPVQKGQVDFIEGRLDELSGEFDKAVTKYENAMDSANRLSRAEGAAARTELLMKLGKITRAQAIDAFEKLRFAWRGDDFEFGQLRRLGRLYMEEGDYRNGLRTLRQAATHFRDHPKAKDVTQEMADAFIYLYLEGGADSLAPVTAIALYDEFKELTPAGPKGDEMIRKLADRLVSVDLLDRAIKLLDDQVRFRLKGKEKSRVGARLALVNMLARHPENALKALDASKVEGIGDDLASQRRHLRARALVELGRTDEALALLKRDDSKEADLLRTDVYWQARDWRNAAKVIQRLVHTFGARPHRPLDEMQARYMLNLAVALTLSGNEMALKQLRNNYGQAMAATTFKSAFRLIASSDTTGLIDYRTIAAKVTDVENFQAFMTAYRERLRSGKLSAIN